MIDCIYFIYSVLGSGETNVSPLYCQAVYCMSEVINFVKIEAESAEIC